MGEKIQIKTASLGSYFLVWPKDQPARAPLRSFRDWLQSTL